MPQSWTHTAAFAKFGVTPRNVQWSWSARNEASQTVVVTLWQDRFERKNGKLIYARPGFDPTKRKSPGGSELMENLAWARDHCEGRFYVIIAKAKDTKAEPRSIDECFPSKMVMRVVKLDEETGAYVAEAVGGPTDAPP